MKIKNSKTRILASVILLLTLSSTFMVTSFANEKDFPIIFGSNNPYIVVNQSE